MRKGLLIVIIGLIVSQGAFASDCEIKDSLPLKLNEGNTLYVGGSGPNNYTKIQDAIDNASHGDTIFVYNGTYSEYQPDYFASIVIDKKINLVGEDKHTTIIDGGHNWDVVRIYASEINVCGFTIQNSKDKQSGFDIVLSNYSENCHIYGNIIKNNYRGFLQAGTTYSEFYDNIITDNICGIYIAGWDVSVHGNIIENNGQGMFVDSSRVTVQENHFENNNVGITLSDSRITISKNNFIDNGKHAVYGSTFWLVHFIMPHIFRSTWRNNYWDDWQLPIPRPIRGDWYYLSPALGEIFGPIPTFQFDWSPVITPYDVGEFT